MPQTVFDDNAMELPKANGAWQAKALILSGPGGKGKTEFACALMQSIAPSGRFHFLNRLDRLRDCSFAPGEGLVVDDVCLAPRDVDDAKSIVDIQKGRDVACRNRDGSIPKGTPRIFTTNWRWEQFWPRDAFLTEHLFPIQRRSLWVYLEGDLRSLPPPGPGQAAGAEEEPGAGGAESEPDVFDHGGSLDERSGGCHGVAVELEIRQCSIANLRPT